VRTAWQSLGRVDYGLKSSESGNIQFRRSLYVARGVRAGELASPDNVRSVRPGYGLACRHFDDAIGKRFRGDFPAGTPLAWDMLE
jgi:N-acetylneuraminate synthase